MTPSTGHISRPTTTSCSPLASVQKSTDANENRLYCDWFDVQWLWGRTGDHKQRRQTVIGTLSAMASKMSSATPVTYHYDENDKNCKANWELIAYTFINSNDVYACKLFNDDFMRVATWNSAEWGRAFAVVHEMSHAAGATKDDWYSWSICQQLATFNPNLAVTNAQNYALYVMMRAGGDLPMTSKYRVRCYDKKSNRVPRVARLRRQRAHGLRALIQKHPTALPCTGMSTKVRNLLRGWARPDTSGTMATAVRATRRPPGIYGPARPRSSGLIQRARSSSVRPRVNT